MMLAISVVVIYLIYRFIFWGHFANFIVSFLEYFVYGDWELALRAYQQIFRNHMMFYLLIAICLVFLVIIRLYLNNFTNYFSEINQALDSLVDENANEVTLSPELSAAEKKINHIKHTLERQKMAARAAEQRKNDLVMYLAHDIRTPLTSVIGYLSLLEEAPDMPPDQKARYVHITLDKAYRLEKMIAEFFEITRYNLQHISLSKENVDLYYMLVQISDEFSPSLAKNGNTTVLRANENLTVCADPDKLARVFNNILKNAAAYSSPNTEVRISAWEEESSVVISFLNRGKTIPAEKLSSIFEKFFRLDEARTSDTGGTGLGLAIAKDIIHLHGGTITAASSDNTVEFRITLPKNG